MLVLGCNYNEVIHIGPDLTIEFKDSFYKINGEWKPIVIQEDIPIAQGSIFFDLKKSRLRIMFKTELEVWRCHQKNRHAVYLPAQSV